MHDSVKLQNCTAWAETRKIAKENEIKLCDDVTNA